MWKICLVCIFSFVALAQAEFNMSHISTMYLPKQVNGSGGDGAEQVVYDKESKLFYAVGPELLHVVNASNPRSMVLLHTKTLNGSDMTDVEFCGGFLFVTVNNMTNRDHGMLRVYRKYNGSDVELVHEVIVGTHPDMVSVRPGCQSALVALEAEAYVNGSTLQNPSGAVLIVKFPQGVEGTSSAYVIVKTLGFEKFNNQYQQLSAKGFRVSYMPQGSTVAQDIEPEYIAIDEKTNIAYVTLQENNAIAEVNLVSEEITAIHGLGYKQFEMLDASDRNGIQISYWPIRGLYQPDALTMHEWQGRKLVFTANEGDGKDYPSVGFSDEIRGSDIPAANQSSEIPQFVRDALKDNNKLGRLTFSSVDGRYPNQTFHSLYTYGGRSFSIWDAENSFELIYDSGSHFEVTTALRCPHLFNGANGEADSRSDDKGPEAESVTVAEMAGRLYIFVGNERPGTIFVYSLGRDVTKPRFEHIFCEGIPPSNETLDQLYTARQVYGVDPEDLKFLPASDSPTGTPVLLVLGTISSSISLIEITPGPSDPSPTAAPDSAPQAKGLNLVLMLVVAIVLNCVGRSF